MIDLVPLLVVAVVAVAAMVLFVVQQGRHSQQINAILAATASERYSAARERWDLNTRITAPEVVRTAPPAPPADAPPFEVLRALSVLQPVPDDEEGRGNDPDEDESFLVGTGPDGA